jgi:hypothetical protein
LITIPQLVCLFLLLFLAFWTSISYSPYYSQWLSVEILILAFVLPWRWGEFATRRWQSWALGRGAPAGQLKKWAVVTTLGWPKGEKIVNHQDTRLVSEADPPTRPLSFRVRILGPIVTIILLGLCCCVAPFLLFSSVNDNLRGLYNFLPQDFRNLVNLPFVHVQGQYHYADGSYVSPDGGISCNFGTLYAGAILADDSSEYGSYIRLSRGYFNNFGDITIAQLQTDPGVLPANEQEVRQVLQIGAQGIRDNDILPHYKNLEQLADQIIEQSPTLHYWAVRGDSDQFSMTNTPIQAFGAISFIAQEKVTIIMLDYAPYDPYPGDPAGAPITGKELGELIKEQIMQVYRGCVFK